MMYPKGGYDLALHWGPQYPKIEMPRKPVLANAADLHVGASYANEQNCGDKEQPGDQQEDPPRELRFRV